MINVATLNLPDLEQQHGLPSGLLAAVMQTESAGNPNAVSPKGAQGLFQFMPATAKQYGIDPLDPNQSADGAARYYADLLKQSGGDLDKALASYNFGPGNVASGKPLPKETQDYISKVKGLLPPMADSGQIANDGMPEGFQLDAHEAALPEGFSLDNAEEKKAGPDRGTLDALANQAVQGVTGNFADELTAYPLAGIDSLIKGKPFGESLKNVRDFQQGEMASNWQNHPVASTAGQVLGSLAGSAQVAKAPIGSAISDWVSSGNTAARVAKGALTGAASGAIYGAGGADDGNRLQGAEQGAVYGGLAGGAIPATGAAASALKSGTTTAVKGAFARSPEALQDAASALKSGASGLYDQMRQVGATFKPSAVQGFLVPDLDKAIAKNNFIPALNPKTLAIVDDLKQKASTGSLGLDELDQYRRLLGRVGGSEDGVSAGAARKVIDDFVNSAQASHLQNGSKAAIDLLKQGRTQYAQASKVEDITDILTKASGDPNKIKAGLTRFLNNKNNLRGYSQGELAALKDAAKSTTAEKLLKMGGKFGIDLGTSLSPGNTIGPIVGGLVNPVVPVGGTLARQGQKYLARGKAENLLSMLQNSGATSAAPASPLLALLGVNASASVASQPSSLRIGLKKITKP